MMKLAQVAEKSLQENLDFLHLFNKKTAKQNFSGVIQITMTQSNILDQHGQHETWNHVRAYQMVNNVFLQNNSYTLAYLTLPPVRTTLYTLFLFCPTSWDIVTAS